tara:strand:- start:628 stop:1239 length:612 start_codon:yes stop_codon:yes gene_type:complete
MRYIVLKIYILIIFIISINNLLAIEKINHKIAVLVNDEIISTYDVTQRMKINAIISGLNITPDNNQLIANSAVEDLINEKLKYEKSIEYEITVNDEEYNSYEILFFQNKPFTKIELINTFKNNNIRYLEFKNYLIGEIAWNKLIGRLYYRLASVSDIEVEEIISKNPNIDIKQAEEIIIQRQLDLSSSKLLRDMKNEATIEYK